MQIKQDAIWGIGHCQLMVVGFPAAETPFKANPCQTMGNLQLSMTNRLFRKAQTGGGETFIFIVI